jgi:hypothetical protein
LLSEAAAGDLTVDGRSISPDELKHWLAREAPLVIRDLVGTVVGGESEPEDLAVERLIEVLREEFLLELEHAAQRAGLTREQARSAAQSQAGLIGHLRGSPEVLYLRPEALEQR